MGVKQADVCGALGTNLGRGRALRFCLRAVQSDGGENHEHTCSTELWVSAKPGGDAPRLWDHQGGKAHLRGGLGRDEKWDVQSGFHRVSESCLLGYSHTPYFIPDQALKWFTGSTGR